MPQVTTKAKIVRAVEDLPENATIEDAIERLVFLHKIEVGLKQAQEGKTVPLDEVEARLKRRRRSRQAE
jgi:predicted transcriptional regulator